MTKQNAAPADETRPHNIHFAISDDPSWMHVGAYGDIATRTPEFDRVAREGVLFNHAYTASPSCAQDPVAGWVNDRPPLRGVEYRSLRSMGCHEELYRAARDR